MRLSLKVKLAAAVTLLFLLLMASIAAIQTVSIRADFVDTIAAHQSTLVNRVAGELDQQLELNLQALTRLASAFPPEIVALPRDIRGHFERRPALFLLFDALLVFTPDGEVVADAPELAGRQGLQVKDREYFQRSLATQQPLISAPYVGRASKRPSIMMLAPIRDGTGRLVGFLGGTLDLYKPKFLGSVAAIAIGKAGYFFVVTKDQPSIFVVHPDQALILKPVPEQRGNPGMERALAGFEGTLEGMNGSGTPTLFTYKSLAATNWLLGIDFPSAEALAPVVAAEHRFWWISALSAMALAPIVWLLTWVLISPLGRLRDDVQRLRTGSMVLPLSSEARQDEIGDLARELSTLIRERQESENALLRSTRLFDNVLDNIPVSIQLRAIHDDYRFVMWNKASEALFGIPKGRALGRNVHEMWSPETIAQVRAADVEAVASGGQEWLDRSVDTLHRGTLRTHVRKVPLFDAEGTATHLLIIMDDISARKAGEEELRSNRAFLQSLIDNIPMAIYVKDVRPQTFGTMVVWNAGAEVISGVPEERALGRTDQEIFDPAVYAEIDAHDRVLLSSPMVSDLHEHPFRQPNGTLVFMRTISAPIFDIDNNVAFILRISEDVTARRRQQRDLRARTAELLAVNDASPLGMFRTSADGRCTYVNRTYEQVSGLSADEALGEGWLGAIYPEDRERVSREWSAAAREKRPFLSLHRFQHRDGRVVWASVQAASVVVDKLVVGFVGTVDDITARRASEHARQAGEQRLRTITDTMPAWVAYIDTKQIYRFTNAAFERGFQLSREDIEGRTIREILGESGYRQVEPYVRQVLNGRTVTFQREKQMPGGRPRWLEATYIPEVEESGKVVGFHAMLQDITSKKLEELRLLRLSEVDSLTGLANRVGFEQRLTDAMAESRKSSVPMAVMYLDIDHFKQVNDTYGHPTGDALLRSFAQRLRESLRKSDLVARLGGDEFVVVLSYLPDEEIAAKLAAKTVAALQRPFVLVDYGVTLSVTTSIGVAIFHNGETNENELVAEADAMLYLAKKRGRNNFFITPWPESV